jgi:cytochrome c oxidase subunit 4
MMMTAYLRGPLFYTWLFLVSATLASALLGLEGEGGAGVALFVLLIALVKCRFVIRTYMEVRTAPRWLRRSCDAWLLGNALMLSSYYWT